MGSSIYKTDDRVIFFKHSLDPLNLGILEPFLKDGVNHAQKHW